MKLMRTMYCKDKRDPVIDFMRGQGAQVQRVKMVFSLSLFLGCLGQVSSSMITLNKVVKGLKLQGLLVEVGFC